MEHTCPNLVQVAAPGMGMGWVVTQLLDSDLRGGWVTQLEGLLNKETLNFVISQKKLANTLSHNSQPVFHNVNFTLLLIQILEININSKLVNIQPIPF